MNYSRNLVAAIGVAALAGCSHATSPSDATAVPQSVATMRATGTLHFALATPAQTTLDLDATCSFDSPYERGGGLRVIARTPQSSVAVIGAAIDHDGDVSWKPDGSGPQSTAPIEVDATLGEASLFTGSTGSTTAVHVDGGGHTGTATFENATYITNGSIGSANGTLSWSCNGAAAGGGASTNATRTASASQISASASPAGADVSAATMLPTAASSGSPSGATGGVPSGTSGGAQSSAPTTAPASGTAAVQSGDAGIAGDARVHGDTNEIVDPNCVAKTAASLLSEDTPPPGPTCGPMKQPAALKAAEQQLQH